MRALDPLALPLAGVRLIEASAGSGKTHTVTTLYLRLLLERGLEVPEILVLTYTNAATAELRERVRRRLGQALAAAEGAAAPDAELAELVARAGGPAGARGRLADALTRLDEASVFTIHGFCQRVLQEHAFESGVPYDLELLADEQDLRREVAEDLWRQRLYGEQALAFEWLPELWPTPSDLLDEVAALLSPAAPAPLPALDGGAAWAELGEAFARAREAWRVGHEAIPALLATAALKRNVYAPERVAAALAEVDRHLAGASPPATLPRDAELLTPAKLAAATRKGEQTPSHPFFECWAAYAGQHPRAWEARRVAFLVEAAAALRSGLTARKAQRRVIGFDDLLAQLDRALAGAGGAALAQGLRTRYPAALVDEFQDTDPLQYRVLRAIYRDAAGAVLVLVGDPKQAIYGFRGADVFTYLAARRDTAAEEGRFTLPTNRRSSPALVTGVNALFGRAARPFLLEDIGFEPARALPREGGGLREDGREPVPIVFWTLERSEANTARREPRVITRAWARARVAQACADTLVALLERGRDGAVQVEGRALQARDVAVLVRDRFEAAEVQAALRRAGVASAFLSRDSVYASETAAELVRLLAALAAPEDEGRLRAALCTTLLGRSASDLERLARDDRAREALGERVRAWADLWHGRGPLPALQRVVHEEAVAVRLLARADGERRLTDLLQLAELLHLAAHGRPGVQALLRWLADRSAAKDGRAEDEELRLESDEDVVSVVTVHRSKGLEYPVVFVPFPWSVRPVDPKGPAAFHDPASGEACLDLGAPPAPGHLALARRERLAEDLRLLYVAVTRARYRVYLSWGAVQGAEESALGYLLRAPGEALPVDLSAVEDRALREVLEDLARTVPGAIAVADLPPPGGRRWAGPGPADVRLAARSFAGRIDRDWRVTSYSALVTGGGGERPDYDPAPEEDGRAMARAGDLPSLPRGSRTGVLLHRVLEGLDFPAARGPGLTVSIARELERSAYPRQWAPALAAGIGRVLDTPLAADGLCLRRLARDRRRDELEFEYPLARITPQRLGEVLRRLGDWAREGARLTFSPVRGRLRGFIDLVFEWRGRYYLADYKSNHLGERPEDYAREALRAAIAEHRYDLQYLLYTLALHRYLGQRLPGYDYERHFGGVYYLFLRGMDPERGGEAGVWFDRPAAAVVTELDRLFEGE